MFKKLFFSLVILIITLVTVIGGIAYWINAPITHTHAKPIPFSIHQGSRLESVVEQIYRAGIPVNSRLLSMWIRFNKNSEKIKAGDYILKPGATPTALMVQLVKGQFALLPITFIEGWTFKQMRQAIAENPALKQDTKTWSETELMAKISTQYSQPEGLFFPNTYYFTKGSSDLLIYKQAHTLMIEKLKKAWQVRDPITPYQTPYEALIMASIVEKETGKLEDRALIAGVLINRLKKYMPLQSDPTVIYGVAERYQGTIYKSYLTQDTPYNTYTRRGLPPTPIALPSEASLTAAMRPQMTDALYFVGKADGFSHFSNTLHEHHQAVNTHVQARSGKTAQ